jgi:hypothetical protein
MIINAVNVNEFLRLGFVPDTLIVLKDNKYFVEDSDFQDFADNQGWEKGLDYSINSSGELEVHIVLEDAADAEDYDADYGTDEDEDEDVEDTIECLREHVKDELEFIKENTGTLTYCRTQMRLIKDVLCS